VRLLLPFARSLGLALFALLFQLTGAHAQQYSFRRYTPEDGLPNLAVNYLARSPSGDLWIGTDGGLFRFDGTAFTTYDDAKGIPPEDIGGLSLGPEGRTWITLVRGLYTQSGDRFTPVSTPAGPVVADFRSTLAFLPDRVLVLRTGHALELEGDSRNWRGHDFFSPAQLANTPALLHIRRLFRTRNGSLWLSCGKQLCSFVAGQVKEWADTDGVVPDDWNAFLEDSLGRIWVRSPQHLIVLEPGARMFESRDPPAAQLDEIRHHPAMVLDAQGRLLVRTGVGLARWEGNGWKQFTAQNGLPAAAISALELDGEGNLWLGMNGLGIWRWRSYENLESWTRAQGLTSEKIWSIVRDSAGRLLLGTSSGCQMLDEHAGRVVGCPVEGLPDLTISAIGLDKSGGIWWGMINGEIWHTAANERRAHQLFAESNDRPEISQIRFDRAGTGWVAALEGGLLRLDPAGERLEKVALPSPAFRIYDIAQDGRDRLWVASSNGVFRMENGQWSLQKAQDAHGNPAVFGSVAVTPDGSLWSASDGKGLLQSSTSDFQQRAWVQADMVTHASVYFVRADGRGWVWLGTDQGVIVFDGKIWRRIDEDDGLVWNDTQVYGFLADNDGSVWIGTSAGLTHIRDPQRLMGAPVPLSIDIASAQLGSELLDPRHPTTVAWHPNAAFDVRFNSHSYSRSPRTEFRYRLIGLSSDWFGSRSPEIHVPALDAGEYRLEALAIDEPHARTSPIISMTFEVTPPWWRTIAFRSAMVLLVAILSALLWRWQYNNLRARRLALEAEFRERQLLLERATRDALTGLWNRATVLDALAREITYAQRNGTPLAIGLIDVDHFKRINDSLGHAGGDEVLQGVSRRLSAALRQYDWLGRYGGEEFIIAFPGLGPAEVESASERLRSCVSSPPFEVNGTSRIVTVSIGMAYCESPTDSVDSIVRRADSALYEAKRSGRNRVAYSRQDLEHSAASAASRRYLDKLLEKVRRESNERRCGSDPGV
jgi:diguanylate cyclase (GGDEF)-like protein